MNVSLFTILFITLCCVTVAAIDYNTPRRRTADGVPKAIIFNSKEKITDVLCLKKMSLTDWTNIDF